MLLPGLRRAPPVSTATASHATPRLVPAVSSLVRSVPALQVDVCVLPFPDLCSSNPCIPRPSNVRYQACAVRCQRVLPQPHTLLD